MRLEKTKRLKSIADSVLRVIKSFSSTILLLLLATPASAKSNIYHYAPEIVELYGTIELQTFPGRPGYESIKKGDEIERGWYLRLDHPIEVQKRKKDADPNSSTETNVKILQLAMGIGTPTDNLPLGKKICVRGYLFHAISGHHHSRVLINVKRIGACS